MKTVPLLLGGGLIAVAALAPLAQPSEGPDYARLFVQCSDRIGPAGCGHFLDEWSKRPNSRREIIERFAKDKAFALQLLAFSDAQILTGSIKKYGD